MTNQQLATFWSRTRDALTSRGQTAFLSAALLLGILVGLGASVLVWSIAFVADILKHANSVAGLGRWIVVISIPLGLLASWSLNRWLGPGVSGGGVAETMVSVNLEGGYLPTRLVPSKIVATATTLGTGGSGGREGPIVLIGAAIGSSFARHSNFGLDQIKSLVAAGAGAGIGASFNAPIAGMIFALEVILQSFAVRHFSAVVVTSVAAAVTTHTLVGEELFLQSPAHELKDPRQLILYAMLSIITVLFGILFLRVLDITSESKLKDWMPAWVLPISLGVGVGLIGIIYPETLGTGERFLTSLLSLQDAGDFVWWSLFLIAALKTVTSALTRKGGGSVGTFMPALVIGGAAGAGFAILVDPIWTVSDIDPGAFALVGMAAALAATARAPLTAVILVFELTGDYGLVLPLMLATALATFLGDRLHPDSTYTMSLARKGIRLPSGEDIDLLDTVRVGEVMSTVDEHATPGMPLATLEDMLERSHHHGLPVVEDEKLVGIVTYTDLSRFSAPLTDFTVSDALTASPIVVTPNMPVSAALARMASLGLGRLPVVADDDPTRLVGMFRRQSIVSAYHHALGTSTGRHLYRDRLKVRTQPGAMFFEVAISKGSSVVGTLVKNIEWPDGAILVSIRRGSRVLIPHGETILEATDILTAFGTGEAREQVAYLVESVGDPAAS
jgi:CIC family chloride channel protein